MAKKVVKLTPKQEMRIEINTLMQRGIKFEDTLKELAIIVERYSKEPGLKISGGDLIRLTSSISKYQEDKISIKAILTAIMPRSKPFRMAWIADMKQIIKEHEVL